MTLGEFIKTYRKEHDDMSVRSFASLAKMSPQQIINIERGIGNDGKPMTSTMKTYKKIAEAVGMDEKDFMSMLNDNVVINPKDEKEPVLKTKDGREIDYDEFMEIVRQLTAENVELLKDQGRVLLNHQKSQDDQ